VSRAEVTARAQGTATLTARVGALTTTAAVVVTAPVLVSIVVRPAVAVVPKGGSVTLHATGVYSDHGTADLTATATWQSSRLAVATVSRGVVTGVRVGAAIVTAAVGGRTGGAAVVVRPG
jgi:hypothetical protein